MTAAAAHGRPEHSGQGGLISPSRSVEFFDTQFQRQLRERDFQLNPFELAALPYLRGRVLDYGCGMGNLAFAAAARGCQVLALDASDTAISHIRQRAQAESAAVQAEVADLRDHAVAGSFDAVASIGLLMFFDCATALRVLERLQAALRPGGIAAVNVLVEGTSYRDMFDEREHCLFARTELESHFAGWEILRSWNQDFDAPQGTHKVFATVIAGKPGA